MTCGVCAGLSGHPPIEDDGFPVCVPCIYRVGRAAGNPLELTVVEAHLLQQMHGDIVTLRSCEEHGFEWEFDRSWPQVAHA